MPSSPTSKAAIANFVGVVFSLFFSASASSCTQPVAGTSDRQQVRSFAGTGVAWAPATSCEITLSEETSKAATHVAPCTPMSFEPFPPASGPHYSSWASFRIYDKPLPWGFLLHAMEHGAVVVAYRCNASLGDVDCEARKQALTAWYAAVPSETRCIGQAQPKRVILVPEPNLETPLVAVAWQHIYEATCFDETSLSSFVREHIGQGPEDICNDGIDPSNSCS